MIFGLFKKLTQTKTLVKVKTAKPAKKTRLKRTSRPKPLKIKTARKPSIKSKRIKRAVLKTKPRSKKPAAVLKKAAIKKEILIGQVSHFFPKVNAAVVTLKKGLKVGDDIIVRRSDEAFEQKVSSMQIDRSPILSASAGQEIGILMSRPVKVGAVISKRA